MKPDRIRKRELRDEISRKIVEDDTTLKQVEKIIGIVRPNKKRIRKEVGK